MRAPQRISRRRPPITGTPRMDRRPRRPVTPSRPSPRTPVSVRPPRIPRRPMSRKDRDYMQIMRQEQAFNQRISVDPNFRQIRDAQNQMDMALRQKEQQYFESLGLRPDQLSGALGRAISEHMQQWKQNQPEFEEIRRLTGQANEYVNETYGPALQNLQETRNRYIAEYNLNPGNTFFDNTVTQFITQGVPVNVQQNPLQGRPPGVGKQIVGQIPGMFGQSGNLNPTSIGNSMFNQDANYMIKGNSLYKDGKFLGTINGGMMGGGRAGENRIVMGNDAVVDVPDWVFETAERQEPDPVVETPSTSTVTPSGPLYDIMTGGLGSPQSKESEMADRVRAKLGDGTGTGGTAFTTASGGIDPTGGFKYDPNSRGPIPATGLASPTTTPTTTPMTSANPTMTGGTPATEQATPATMAPTPTPTTTPMTRPAPFTNPGFRGPRRARREENRPSRGMMTQRPRSARSYQP